MTVQRISEPGGNVSRVYQAAWAPTFVFSAAAGLVQPLQRATLDQHTQQTEAAQHPAAMQARALGANNNSSAGRSQGPLPSAGGSKASSLGTPSVLTSKSCSLRSAAPIVETLLIMVRSHAQTACPAAGPKHAHAH